MTNPNLPTDDALTDDALTETDKERLLEYLRTAPGTTPVADWKVSFDYGAQINSIWVFLIEKKALRLCTTLFGWLLLCASHWG